MGLTDVFNSVTEKVKRNCPNVATPVGNACQSSYNLGRAVVFKIDKVVRVNGSQKLKEYIPSPEVRQKIGLYAFSFLDSPLGKEGLKQIPGASLGYETYKWSQSVQDNDKTKGKQAGAHKVEADAHLKYEKGDAWRSSGSFKAADPASVKAATPEDVLRDFIQNGPVG